MPLPDEAITVTGGCNCGAIRYRIAIPPVSQRPNLPFSPPSEGITLPVSMTCHCNDCRRATASLLAPAILQVPAPMITVSALSPGSGSSSGSAAPTRITGRVLDVLADDYDAAKADADRPPYRPATEVLRAMADDEPTWLRFFHSFDCGASFSRAFCGRCGTHFCFHFALTPDFTYDGRLPDGWSDLFDIYLGSVDRRFLDTDWLDPESEIHFGLGTLFAKRASASSIGLKHLPKSISMTEEDGVATKEELRALSQ
jgi:hypothetical protein